MGISRFWAPNNFLPFLLCHYARQPGSRKVGRVSLEKVCSVAAWSARKSAYLRRYSADHNHEIETAFRNGVRALSFSNVLGIYKWTLWVSIFLTQGVASRHCDRNSQLRSAFRRIDYARKAGRLAFQSCRTPFLDDCMMLSILSDLTMDHSVYGSFRWHQEAGTSMNFVSGRQET